MCGWGVGVGKGGVVVVVVGGGGCGWPVVPFNTDVFQAFGLLQHSTQGDVMSAIGECVCV